MTAPGIPCPKCGARNREDAAACYLCGEGLRDGTRPETSEAVRMLRGGGDAGAPRLGSIGGPGGAAKKDAAGPPGGPRLDFAEAAARNARLSWTLFFCLFAVLFALGTVIGRAFGSVAHGIALSMVLYAILAGVAYFSGASIVLSIHGAREADPATHRQLLNVVEEMRIASGIPRPRVYVMETAGMNAFAAGRRPEEALVAVTTGLVEGLNRDELQGVVAHEMAHIRSRDTYYGICAAVLVGAIALLADMFLRGAPFRGQGRVGERSGVRGNAAFLVLGILLALLAPLAAKLLQMSISRQREYHADAAGAAFTRNPLGLASALEKIAAGGAQVPGENRGTQHLFIVNPLRSFTERSSALLATHPPTELRIQRLKRMAGI